MSEAPPAMQVAARILLIEDEDDARQMLQAGLERIGHTVTACADGAAALARLAADIQVVVTDLIMPREDGLAVLRGLRDRAHPALRIVTTAYADKERTLSALNLGANYLLEKPVSVARIDQVIQQGLGARTDVALEHIFQRQIASLPLSERERRLVFYALKGLSNADIAGTMGSSEASVKSAFFALYRKLAITSRGELFHLIFPL